MSVIDDAAGKGKRMTRRWQSIAAMAVLALALTGCGNEGDIQALIFDGPWPVEVASFGMQPSGAGCPDGSYKFDLARSTEVDPAQHEELGESVREHLTDAGHDVEAKELGSGDAGVSAA